MVTRRVIRNVAAAHAWEGAKRSLEEEHVWLMREASAMIAAGDGAGLARLLSVAPAGMEARPPREAGVVVDAQVERTQSLGSRDGLAPEDGVMSEEEFLAANAAEDGEEDDGWEDGAVAD